MKRTLISLLLLITAPVVFAQTSPPPPFVIGFHGFGPEWNPNSFRQHFIQGYLSNPVTDFERYNFVGDTIFARTRELGATLISGYLDPPAVTTTPNVTRQLSDQAHPPAHPQPLDMAVIDLGLDTYLKGERIVHPAVLRSSGLPSGFHFYRLTTDTGVIQRKMLLMR